MRESIHKYKVGNSQNVPSSNGNRTQKEVYSIAKLSLSRTVNSNINEHKVDQKFQTN